MTASASWTPAYVGVGSNLQSPREQVLRGLDALASIPETQLIARSRLYQSSALTGPDVPNDQPQFVNAVAGLLTQLDAHSLLAQLKRLESDLGRERPAVRWGPRIIDFDLLVFGAATVDSDSLKIPHPGLASRNFVLHPLCDIAPDLKVPGLGVASQLSANVERGDLSVLQ